MVCVFGFKVISTYTGSGYPFVLWGSCFQFLLTTINWFCSVCLNFVYFGHRSVSLC